MLGKIIAIEENMVIVSLDIDLNESDNLIAHHVLMKDDKRSIIGEIVDIKDNTAPGYASEAMKKYSPTSYEKAMNSFEKYQSAIKKLKDAGYYVIGRITVFKDSFLVSDHQEVALKDTSTGSPDSASFI